MSKLKILAFSFRRNLQLDAFLESLNNHCWGEFDIEVYNKDCSDLRWGEFRGSVRKAINGYEYVMFCVDDTIFTHDFSLDSATRLLDIFRDAIGFSLRLGFNTTYCYMKDKQQEVPVPAWGNGKSFSYNWTKATLDFAYPLEVSSSVYRVADIWGLLRGGKFDNPTELEILLHRKRHDLGKNFLLCFEQSVAFSAPFNRVQTKFPSNRSQAYTVEFFEELYRGGSRIDVDKYSGLVTNAAHQEVDLILTGD